jgi:hypothetical protein
MKRILFILLATALHAAGQTGTTTGTITPPTTLPSVTGTLTSGIDYIVLGTDGLLHLATAAQVQAQASSGAQPLSSALTTLAAGNPFSASGAVVVGGTWPNLTLGLASTATFTNVTTNTVTLGSGTLTVSGGTLLLNGSAIAGGGGNLALGGNTTNVLTLSSNILNLAYATNAANGLVKLDGTGNIPAGLMGNYSTLYQPFNAATTLLGNATTGTGTVQVLANGPTLTNPVLNGGTGTINVTNQGSSATSGTASFASSAPWSGVVNGPVEGTVEISSGSDAVTVAGLSLPYTPSYVFCIVRKSNAAAANYWATVRGGTVSSTGFTADLSGIVTADSYTYNLDYWIVP